MSCLLKISSHYAQESVIGLKHNSRILSPASLKCAGLQIACELHTIYLAHIQEMSRGRVSQKIGGGESCMFSCCWIYPPPTYSSSPKAPHYSPYPLPTQMHLLWLDAPVSQVWPPTHQHWLHQWKVPIGFSYISHATINLLFVCYKTLGCCF